MRIVRGTQGFFDDGWYIVSWEGTTSVDTLEPVHGPFPTLKTAKLAYLIIA